MVNGGLLGCIATLSIAAAERPPADSSVSTRGLDLTQIALSPIYAAEFSEPLRFIKESVLFEGGRRVRAPPVDVDWVLEGNASARVEDGRLYLTNDQGHLVFWSTRQFPADFLLEFDVSPEDSRNGLNIVFFAATALDGGSIFGVGQPKRAGVFKMYHSGSLNSYHASYWANHGPDKPRETVHLRKNRGFHLVAIGRDFITGNSRASHRVRVLKLNGRIEVEVDGKIAVEWKDDGRNFGAALGPGFIGLRQMEHTRECSYEAFKVWKVSLRGDKRADRLN